ncbi:hypothetical protein Corgl_0013 [Coriobacterium glomerans PW2]|uniref:Uncharacterized protein n=1 Tax=Coriobacterium glomerans (strain ATCC 49209 / DSM 20642 / JCM 10262 / PW2) TaxID=700015 RepID=F2N6U4_CORGP|nr:hypothetical protein Corgl_0013 [Coriobacterium glomerans PW2]
MLDINTDTLKEVSEKVTEAAKNAKSGNIAGGKCDECITSSGSGEWVKTQKEIRDTEDKTIRGIAIGLIDYAKLCDEAAETLQGNVIRLRDSILSDMNCETELGNRIIFDESAVRESCFTDVNSSYDSLNAAIKRIGTFGMPYGNRVTSALNRASSEISVQETQIGLMSSYLTQLKSEISSLESKLASGFPDVLKKNGITFNVDKGQITLDYIGKLVISLNDSKKAGDQKFAQTIADSLLDDFKPSKYAEDLKEFADLLKSMGKVEIGAAGNTAKRVDELTKDGSALKSFSTVFKIGGRVAFILDAGSTAVEVGGRVARGDIDGAATAGKWGTFRLLGDAGIGFATTIFCAVFPSGAPVVIALGVVGSAAWNDFVDFEENKEQKNNDYNHLRPERGQKNLRGSRGSVRSGGFGTRSGFMPSIDERAATA